MKVFSAILFFLLSILLSCTGKNNPRPITHIQHISRPDSLHNIVALLSENNSIGDNIGIGGSSYRFDLYCQLNKIATTNELDSLTDHQNPAVRYYSFRALVNRHSDQVFDILVKHMNDTMRLISYSGCSGMEETVASNLVMLVKSNNVESAGYKLNENQTKIIDSLYRIYPDPVYITSKAVK